MTHSLSLAMRRCSIEPRTRKYVKGFGFLSFAKRNIKKQLLDTELDTVRTASKKVAHKTVEFLRNKIADAVTKSNDDNIVKSGQNLLNVEEIITTPDKGEKILNKLRKLLYKWNIIKYLNY